MPQYSKTTWVDGTAPAISAANLNKLEQGVFDSLRQDGSTTMSAQLVTIAGTAATPAIAPTGDSNTGIFFPAANSMGVTIDGSERVRFKSNGFVGVGDLDPSYRLDVVNYAATPLRVQRSGEYGEVIKIGRAGVSDTAGISYPADGTFQITTAATPRMTINASGNVGIGTVSPADKLHVDGNIYLGTANRTIYTAGAGTLTLQTGTGSFTIARNNAADTSLRIDSSGNVGIGINAPTSQLHVYNNGSVASLMVETNTTGGDSKIALKTNGTGGRHWYWQTGDNGSGLNGRLRLWDSTAGSERLNVDSNGYLLIGYTTSNGAYPLQVNGQIFATSSTIATSDGRYKKDIVSLDGALDIVAALNPVQFNWKEHPVHKFNTDVPTIGFIAQEVAEVLKDKAYLTSVIKKSECTWETETGETVEREVTRDVETQVEREVIEEVDGEEVTRTVTETVIEQVIETVTEPVKETHTEEFYGIAESNMIAILTKAIQELNAKVEALEAQIAK
jgi:hypothetical protein